MSNLNYAFIKNGIVINVAAFENPTNELLEIFKKEYDLDSLVISNEKTTIGGEYDGQNFWRIQPYFSWVKNYTTKEWEAPLPYPTNDRDYIWDENNLCWILVEEPVIVDPNI